MALFAKKIRFLQFVIPIVLALIFFSLTNRTFRRAPWYEEALWNLFSPPQRLAAAISSSIRGGWSRYFALVGVEKENEKLREKIAGLEGDLIRKAEVEEENQRLRNLLAYHDAFPQKTIVAKVIANDPRAEFKSITINKGTKDGVLPLMPVVGPRGLVGKVGSVSPRKARVLLITDPNSAVDAVVQRSRARGLVVGTAWHTELKAGYYLTRLEYMLGASDIKEGDIVVTSGLDSVFPPGIPIGTVHDLKSTRYGVFKEANVVPFENMAELQVVMALLSGEGR